MGTIYPTHTCFDDAVQTLAALAKQRDRRWVRLVHGICSPEGRPLAHAWVEDLKAHEAYFTGILEGKRVTFAADRYEFRAELNVLESTSYTIQEALAAEEEHGIGPWESRYRALCLLD